MIFYYNLNHSYRYKPLSITRRFSMAHKKIGILMAACVLFGVCFVSCATTSEANNKNSTTEKEMVSEKDMKDEGTKDDEMMKNDMSSDKDMKDDKKS